MSNQKSFANIINKRYHFTYQTRNNINGMLYIGRHSTDNINDGYIGSGKLLRRAISKYGKDNFSIEILCFFDSLQDLIEEEKFIVDDSWCKNPKSYNIVLGGSNPIMIGENNPSWKGGVKYIKKGMADTSGSNNPMYGKRHSQESKNKMSASRIGSTNKYKGIRFSKEKRESLIDFQKTCKPISVFGFHFKSIRSCARELGVSQDFIQRRIRDERYVNFIRTIAFDCELKYNGEQLDLFS